LIKLVLVILVTFGKGIKGGCFYCFSWC